MKSTTVCFDPLHGLSFESFHVKGFVMESLLVVAVAAFWLVILPVVTAALIALKAWDTIVYRPTPLLIRRQLAAPRGIIQTGIRILDLHTLRNKSRCWSWP
jgi:hypothetical protein